MRKMCAGAVAVLMGLLARPVPAQQTTPVNIMFQNGQFAPAQVRATADAPFTLKVTNLDLTPLEFASAGLRIDRMISPRTSVLIDVDARSRGRYTFVDAAHGATHGVLILE